MWLLGGTSGCIIASRLADADPNLSILVVEHGPNNQNNPLVTHPLLWRAHLAPETGTTIYYIGKNEAQLGNRGVYVATGGILGGGSSINLSMYTRAQAIDYDAWNTKGWSSDELAPYMNKVCYIFLFALRTPSRNETDALLAIGGDVPR